VKGIYDLQSMYEAEYGPGDYIPPVAVVYWSFRIMVGVGILLGLLALYALFMAMGDMFMVKPRALRLYSWAIALPYLANTAGWMMTEMGRVPWVVYGLMKIDDAVSPTLTSGQVLASLVIFTLIYGALMVADVYLLVKFARRVPGEGEAMTTGDEEPMPSLVSA